MLVLNKVPECKAGLSQNPLPPAQSTGVAADRPALGAGDPQVRAARAIPGSPAFSGQRGAILAGGLEKLDRYL